MSVRRHETSGDRARRIEQAARMRAERAASSTLSRGMQLSRIAGMAGSVYFVAAVAFGIGPPTTGFAVWGFCIAGVLSQRVTRARLKDATAVLAVDARPPILYLRPFGMDGLRVKRAW